MHVIPDIRGRRSIRLKGWDYSSPGWYYVTLCLQNRESLFGHIADNKISLTDSGRMVEKAWLEMPVEYPGIALDEFIIMPNHVHGILGLYVGVGPRACPFGAMEKIVQNGNGRTSARGTAGGSAPTKNRLSLPDVIRQFKTLTGKIYSDNVTTSNWPEFQKRLWQRNYYEHIIRNEGELDHCRHYIRDNPVMWLQDEENPIKKIL